LGLCFVGILALSREIFHHTKSFLNGVELAVVRDDWDTITHLLSVSEEGLDPVHDCL